MAVTFTAYVFERKGNQCAIKTRTVTNMTSTTQRTDTAECISINFGKLYCTFGLFSDQETLVKCSRKQKTGPQKRDKS